jgi:F-type H+-transporting ATPase subunit delta
MASPAARYARALYAETDADALRRTANALDGLGEAISETDGLRDLLSNPLIPIEAQKDTLLALTPSDAPETLRSFVSLLADKRRLILINEIAKAFRLLLTEAGEVLYITVASARPLDEGQYERLRKVYAARYNVKAVEAERVTDPSLIGGVRVQAGDFVSDGTVKMKIQRISSLLDSGFTKRQENQHENAGG